MPAVTLRDGNVVMLSEDPQEAAKQFAELELLTSPSANRPDTFNSLVSETGKGVARGLVNVGEAIGKGLAPPPGNIAGYDVSMPRLPAMEQARSAFDQAVARKPDASSTERGFGTFGEVLGGMFFPALGSFNGLAKAGLKSLEEAAPAAVKAGVQRIEPYLPEALAPAVKEVAPVAAAPVGPVANQYTIPYRTAKDLLTNDRTIAAVPIPKKVAEKPPSLPPPFPPAPKTETVPPPMFAEPKAAAPIASSSTFPEWGKDALGALSHMPYIPPTWRWAARFGYNALMREMRNGSTPAEAFVPRTPSQFPRRLSQGVITQLPEDEQ